MKSIRGKLLSGELCVGTWIQTGHSAVAEQLARSGFDWVCADMEHTAIRVDAFSQLVRAMADTPAVPLARVLKNDIFEIRSVLDNGASGVIVPLVETAEEAARAVMAAKYPPTGCRGFGYCQSNEWGERFDEYTALANDRISVVVMAETKKTIENLDEIASVPGIDGIFIGPYDLSGSYGVAGQVEHPFLHAAFERVVAACARRGIAAGLHIVRPDAAQIERAVREGFRFIALGMDNVFMLDGAKRALRELAAAQS